MAGERRWLFTSNSGYGQTESYGAAHRDLGLTAEHETGQYNNNRAENSHQPSRQRERQLRGFKPPGHVQRFLAAHGPINDLFRHDRHLLSARAYRELRKRAFSAWQDITVNVVAMCLLGRL